MALYFRKPVNTAAARFEIAVEDRFLLVRLAIQDSLLPEGDVLSNVAAALVSLRPPFTVRCDFTQFADIEIGRSNVTSDAIDVVRFLLDSGATILCTPQTAIIARRWFGLRAPMLTVSDPKLPVRYSAVDLAPFSYDELDADGLPATYNPSEEEFNYLRGTAFHVDEFQSYEMFLRELHEQAKTSRSAFLGLPIGRLLEGKRRLQQFVNEHARNSLLTEFAIQRSPDRAIVTTYHSHAIYSVETEQTLMVVQPAVLAQRTANLFTEEIRGLEILVNTEGIREIEIQRYLENHPNILKVLGYRDIFSQVVLRRDDGSSLRPDFLLRPVGNDWCDILDIKRPTPLKMVGGRDRMSMPYALHALGSQLREYGRYFENEKYARRVEDALGIKCYRPTLIGIIGRDLSSADERQMRASMSTYDKTRVYTFDELVRVARSNILI